MFRKRTLINLSKPVNGKVVKFSHLDFETLAKMYFLTFFTIIYNTDKT